MFLILHLRKTFRAAKGNDCIGRAQASEASRYSVLIDQSLMMYRLIVLNSVFIFGLGQNSYDMLQLKKTLEPSTGDVAAYSRLGVNKCL